MASIGSLYEKIKPYISLALAVCVIWLVVSNILGTRQRNDDKATVAGIVESQLESREYIRSVVSDLSLIKEGVTGIEESVDELRLISDGIGVSVSALEDASLRSGDESTESGILADRLFRVNRELRERYQADETE